MYVGMYIVTHEIIVIVEIVVYYLYIYILIYETFIIISGSHISRGIPCDNATCRVVHPGVGQVGRGSHRR